MMSDLKSITCVIFDIGGVVVKSPLLGIHKFEKAHGLPVDYLNVAITARGSKGAFQKLELGKLQLNEFYEQFGNEMSDLSFNNNAYLKFCSNSNRMSHNLPSTLQVDGKKLWKQMMAESLSYNQPIIKLIKRLRDSGKYQVAALTNNFQIPSGTKEGDDESLGSAPPEVKKMFDDYIESSQVGLRKPDPKFFEYALNRLKVKNPKEVLFLDDIGINVKAAASLGINTIKVGIYDIKPALIEAAKYFPDLDLTNLIFTPNL